MAAKDSGTGKARRGLLLPLLAGLGLAVAGAGGGYWSITRGPLSPATATDGDPGTAVAAAPDPLPLPDTVFVPLDPVVVSLGPAVAGRQLLFTAHLEVPGQHVEEVTRLIPRVLDVLNGYLRVIDVAELGEPTSLAILRAQLLRRIQVVTGDGRVNDLLVTQFVVN